MNNQMKQFISKNFNGKRIIFLTIKKQWFDMIKNGEKKEEYREISKYWRERVLKCSGLASSRCSYGLCDKCSSQNKADYDIIIFFNGPYYSLNLPFVCLEYKGVEIGKGNKEWGAPDEDVFKIKLGKVIYV